MQNSYHTAILETAAHFIGAAVDPDKIKELKNRGGYNNDWKLTAAIISEVRATVASRTRGPALIFVAGRQGRSLRRRR